MVSIDLLVSRSSSSCVSFTLEITQGGMRLGGWYVVASDYVYRVSIIHRNRTSYRLHRTYSSKIGDEVQGWALRDARITYGVRAPRQHCFSILSYADFVSMTSLRKANPDQERSLLLLRSEVARLKSQRKTLSLRPILKISVSVREQCPFIAHFSTFPTIRPGHSSSNGLDSLCQMARIRPPTASKGYLASASEGSSCHRSICPHPR